MFNLPRVLFGASPKIFICNAPPLLFLPRLVTFLRVPPVTVASSSYSVSLEMVLLTVVSFNAVSSTVSTSFTVSLLVMPSLDDLFTVILLSNNILSPSKKVNAKTLLV